jgi:hypothetical protein
MCPANAGSDWYSNKGVKTADEIPVSAPDPLLAGLSEDYPVNTFILSCLVWFPRHNSKGKARHAILWIELRR